MFYSFTDIPLFLFCKENAWLDGVQKAVAEQLGNSHTILWDRAVGQYWDKRSAKLVQTGA